MLFSSDFSLLLYLNKIVKRNEQGNETQKESVCICNFEIGKSIEKESRLVVTRSWNKKGMGSDCFMGMGFPFGMTKKFWN